MPLKIQAFLVCVFLLADGGQSLLPKSQDSSGLYSYTKQKTDSDDLRSDHFYRKENASGDVVSERRNRNQKVSDQDIEAALKECVGEFSDMKKLEEKLAQKGRVVTRKQKRADSSQNRASKSDPISHRLEEVQIPLDLATAKLYRKFSLSSSDVANDLPNRQLSGANGRQITNDCQSAVGSNQCDRNAVYRTANGTCNNLRNTEWGSAFSCFQRLTPASYVGEGGFRQSVGGGPLPEPRTLSLNIHNHANRPTDYVNHLYMFFGQLLDHDITFTPQSVTVDNQAIECCPVEEETHPQCAAIAISRNDPFYSQYGVRCLNFVRSSVCPSCTLGPRNQINQVTGFIDASFVYGNTNDETAGLRRNDGTGMLRSQSTSSGELLPQSSDPDNDQCSLPQNNQICFEAGDARVNQTPVLASLHTVFHREHNRIASALQGMNPQWDGERTFQETRRILGAMMQAIVYKEYLPPTIGNERMSYFGLFLTNRGTTNYDANRNPTLYNAFSTAAFRFGHSLIETVLARNWPNRNSQLLRNSFFQPFQLYERLMDPLLSGVSRSPAQAFDRHVVPDVTNFLYRVPGNETGLDLPAFNIQRGRDHGMSPYVDVVYFCSEGEIDVRSFNDLVEFELMTRDDARLLSNYYGDVRDIDLWTGIVNEIYNNGAVVGPTATCIIGLQFQALKYGDRFYFEHGNQRGSFTNQQLEELKRIRLSHIICVNTDIEQMPENAMLFSSRNNPQIDCSRVRGINLSYWRTST